MMIKATLSVKTECKMTALITSFVNPKGGSGKTVAAVNLAAGIASLSYKVLLIDLDAHAGASLALGLCKDDSSGLAGSLIADNSVMACIENSRYANLDVIKGSDDLVAVQVALYNKKDGLLALKNIIEEFRRFYDYIFIDCPSSVDVLALNAMCASDAFIVPLPCEYYATSALASVIENVETLRQKRLCRAILAGILLCQGIRGETVLNEIHNEAVKNFRGSVFKTIIPEDNHLDESLVLGRPVVIHAQDSLAGKAFGKLCDEFVYKSPFWFRS